MSYSLAISSFAINGTTGHLIVNYVNGTSTDLGLVVGAAGASGDLFTPLAKSASYTLVAGDLTGMTTPEFEVNPTTANCVFTIDPALLFNSTTGTSLAVIVKHDPTDASGNTVTVTPKTGCTLENGAAGVGMVLPLAFAYTIIAKNATTLRII